MAYYTAEDLSMQHRSTSMILYGIRNSELYNILQFFSFFFMWWVTNWKNRKIERNIGYLWCHSTAFYKKNVVTSLIFRKKLNTSFQKSNNVKSYWKNLPKKRQNITDTSKVKASQNNNHVGKLASQSCEIWRKSSINKLQT